MWRFWKQGAREGIWSKTKERNEGKHFPHRPFCQTGSCRGCVGKRRRPRLVSRHAPIAAAGYWGLQRSVLALWLRLEAKPEPAMGPGATRHSGNGGPQTCLPAARSVAPPAAPYGPSSPANIQDPREGPSLVRRMMQDLLRGGLTRQAREDAERSRQGVPREVLVTQAMTIEARRAPARTESLLPLWC